MTTLSLELIAFGAAQVAVFVGFMVRLESRLTRIETVIELTKNDDR